MRNLAKHLPDSSGFDLKHILVEPGKPISLKKDFDPAYSGNFKDKEETLTELRLNIEQLACQQDILYANDTYALLVVLQALDAAGKDSTIKHVMSGVNPQGCEVHSFKAPSQEELDHDYLWRAAKRLPRRGAIGIFNRSYYEEVLVVRVHPELLAKQHLPPRGKGPIDLEKPIRRDQLFREVLGGQRHNRLEVIFERFEEGTESRASSNGSTRKRRTGSFRAPMPSNADIGRSTWRHTKICSLTPAPIGRPGSLCPPITNGSRAFVSPRLSSLR